MTRSIFSSRRRM